MAFCSCRFFFSELLFACFQNDKDETEGLFMFEVIGVQCLHTYVDTKNSNIRKIESDGFFAILNLLL